jgi:hypothetical protein
VSLIYLLGTVFSMCPGWGESAGKPGSVVDSHSSGRCVTAGLKQPTREPCGPHASSPIWSCSRWGLPCHACYQPRGALLPHHFTLTCTARKQPGGIFSVALSMGSRPPGVTWRPVRRSPDFPLHCYSDCLANSGSLGSGFYSNKIIGGEPRFLAIWRRTSACPKSRFDPD